MLWRKIALTHAADLERIDGLTRRDAALLMAAGVHSVSDLSRRRAWHLAGRIGLAQVAEAASRILPAQSTVRRWIDHARGLEHATTR